MLPASPMAISAAPPRLTRVPAHPQRESRSPRNPTAMSVAKTGVIAGYTTRVRPEQVGLPVSAFIRIRFHGAGLDAFFEDVRSHEAVSECHRVTGSDDVILRVRAASVDRLEDHLDAFLDYGEITTSIVLSSAVEQRPIQEPGSPQDSG